MSESLGPDDAELEQMRAAAKEWAESSGDWSAAQWQAVNAALRPAVERMAKKAAARARARQRRHGPPTKP